jgi:hypothetical protein
VFSEGFWESLINLPSMCSGSRAKSKWDRASGSSQQSQSKDEDTLELQSVAEIFADLCHSQLQTTQIHVSSTTNTTNITNEEESVDCDNARSESEQEQGHDHRPEDEDDEDDDFLYRITWKPPSSCNSQIQNAINWKKSPASKTKDLYS